MRRAAQLTAILVAALVAGCGSSGGGGSLLDMATLERNVVNRLNGQPGHARITSATCLKTGETTASCTLSYAEGSSPSEEGPGTIEVDIAPNGQSWQQR